MNRARNAQTAARIALGGLAVFTLVAVVGYATFGRNPQWLAQWPDLIGFYGRSFSLFAQGHVWLAAGVLGVVLVPRVGRRFVLPLLVVAGLAFTAEHVGTGTGFPFGGYAYTELLGPRLGGRVPWLIPLSWFLMALPAYAIVVRRMRRPGLLRKLMVASLLLLVWDLALDPAMSWLVAYWTWTEDGWYYGMPMLNLFGWYVTGLALMAALHGLRVDAWVDRVPLREWKLFYGLQLAMPLGMLLAAAAWPALLATAAGLAWVDWLLRRPAPAAGDATVLDTASPSSALDDRVWNEATTQAREALARRLQEARAMGLASHDLDGQLIRPLVALAGARGLGMQPEQLDERFWWAVLATQMAHEASLLHDDILDEAPERRGRATLVARAGVGAALVQGDHLLTSAYRAAALSQSPAFMAAFAEAVERTVAGEIAQARSVGRELDMDRYDEIVRGKSGELFGIALATAALVHEREDARRLRDLGRDLGRGYQMLDDLLDWCPAAETGKPPLQDLRQQKWTWPRRWLPDLAPEAGVGEVRAALLRVGEGPQLWETPLQKLRRAWQAEMDDLRARTHRELAGSPVLLQILAGWDQRALHALTVEQQMADGSNAWLAPLAGQQAPTDWLRVFAGKSRSFRFAARWFPPAVRDQVAGVYAFCRFTDDLVDEAGRADVDELEARLDAWQTMASRAWYGEASGIPLLDRVMREAATHGVPFREIAELIEGMRMDLRPRRYADMADLQRYTHRVASVVGLWLTRLWGVDDPDVLRRAALLGHAMQLTNILRDVGEDLARGRIYLPADRLAAAGLDAGDLHRLAAGDPDAPWPAWRALVESLLAEAERAYADALVAVPALPGWARLPVMVAAFVYRGIHDRIRAHGYDNLRRRAVTGSATKLRLAFAAWRELGRLETAPPRRRPAAVVNLRGRQLGTDGGHVGH